MAHHFTHGGGAVGPVAVPAQRPRRLSVKLDRATASAFERAKEKGLHSQNFDVDKNIEEKDTRNMADEEILEEIMKKQHCSFDEARLILVKKRMIEAGIDPETGLPLDQRAVSFDDPRNKVTLYDNQNMVAGKIGDPNGDGYVGKYKTIQEAINAAVDVMLKMDGGSDGVYFTWHKPRGDEKWAGRLFVWSKKRAEAVGRTDPKKWPENSGHTSGFIERIGVSAPPSLASLSAEVPVVVDCDLYDDLNLVNGRIKNENRDGYAGIASTVQEAVNLACRLYEDQQLTGDCIYFAWHDIDMPSLSVLGVTIAESSWAGRVYAWTDERAAKEGRQDPKTWVRQKQVISGKIFFERRPVGSASSTSLDRLNVRKSDPNAASPAQALSPVPQEHEHGHGGHGEGGEGSQGQGQKNSRLSMQAGTHVIL